MRFRKINKNKTFLHNFRVNQIVDGKVYGTFIILGFRTDLGNGELYAQLKTVNPKNFTETGLGELSLPVSALKEVF